LTVEEADRRRVYRVKIEPAPSFPPAALSNQPEALASSRLKADR
jgi:hypothetical protein